MWREQYAQHFYFMYRQYRYIINKIHLCEKSTCIKATKTTVTTTFPSRQILRNTITNLLCFQIIFISIFNQHWKIASYVVHREIKSIVNATGADDADGLDVSSTADAKFNVQLPAVRRFTSMPG